VWLAPPGGWPEAAHEPFDAARFRRFDRHTPTALRWYVLGHYAVINLMLAHFLAILDRLGMAQQIGYAAIMTAMMLVLGGLLEGRAWARPAEALRLLLLAAATLLPDWFGLAAPLWLRAGVALAALACLGWLVRGAPRTAPAE
jgi:alkylglycerol monooxygenase